MKRKLTELDRTAIIAHRASGKAVTQIAADLGVSRQTVHKELRRSRLAQLDGLEAASLRSQLRRKSLEAVLDGLSSPSELAEDGLDPRYFDLYKRANLGERILTGLGEFRTNIHHSNTHRLENLPPEWQKEYGYISPDMDEIREIEAHEVDDKDEA